MNFESLKTQRMLAQSETAVEEAICCDPLNNEVAAFVSSSELQIIPSLSDYESTCKHSYLDFSRIIASNIDRSFVISGNCKLRNSSHMPKELFKFNSKDEYQRLEKYTLPSEFVARFCTLDGITNAVKVWEMGTGKLLREIDDLEYDFQGFTKHSMWEESTLVLRRKEEKLDLEIEENIRSSQN